MAPREADRIAAAQQTLDSTLLCLLIPVGGECKHFLVLYDISQLLGTQLDKETLATCIGMIESGVNPEALAVSV
jgi:mitotic-spindle organizing protein 1